MRATVLAIVAAVALLSLSATSQALAGPVRGHPRPKPPPQVNGAQLKNALLPASAFGDGYSIGATLDSGRKLVRQKATVFVPRMSCSDFEMTTTVSGFGNTAGATEEFSNANALSQYPTAVFFGWQTVVQFASDGPATWFFKAAQAKYRSCTEFTTPNPGDTVPGGGNLNISLDTVNWTSVAGARAFATSESVALSESPGMRKLYLDVLFALSGTNVYEFWEVSGINDVPYPPMTQLVHRVQALYHR
ncbi:MAG TPA: hypothetical protein VKU39_16600 [Streptosporangiaceae bacterium]|nr:hypothetical protein [Streptosporangiaceae bacterium]